MRDYLNYEINVIYMKIVKLKQKTTCYHRIKKKKRKQDCRIEVSVVSGSRDKF